MFPLVITEVIPENNQCLCFLPVTVLTLISEGYIKVCLVVKVAFNNKRLKQKYYLYLLLTSQKNISW